MKLNKPISRSYKAMVPSDLIGKRSFHNTILSFVTRGYFKENTLVNNIQCINNNTQHSGST